MVLHIARGGTDLAGDDELPFRCQVEEGQFEMVFQSRLPVFGSKESEDQAQWGSRFYPATWCLDLDRESSTRGLKSIDEGGM